MIILKDIYNLISDCVFDSGKKAEKELFYKRSHFLGSSHNITLNEYDLSNGTVKQIRDNILNENLEIEGDYFLVKRNRSNLTYTIISYASFDDLEDLKKYTYDNEDYDDFDVYMIFKGKLYFYKKYNYNTNRMNRFCSRLAFYEPKIAFMKMNTDDEDKSYLNLKVFKEKNIFIYYSFHFNKYVVGLSEDDCRNKFIDFLTKESLIFEKLIEEGETDLYSFLLDMDYLKDILETSIEE